MMIKQATFASNSVSIYAAVNCSDAPAAPVNGRRNVSGTTVGSIVTYTCNHGYSPSAQGPNRITRICMANGSWNGTAPECYRKLPCNYNNAVTLLPKRCVSKEKSVCMWSRIVISVFQCLWLHRLVCKLNLFQQILLLLSTYIILHI